MLSVVTLRYGYSLIIRLRPLRVAAVHCRSLLRNFEPIIELRELVSRLRRFLLESRCRPSITLSPTYVCAITRLFRLFTFCFTSLCSIASDSASQCLNLLARVDFYLPQCFGRWRISIVRRFDAVRCIVKHNLLISFRMIDVDALKCCSAQLPHRSLPLLRLCCHCFGQRGWKAGDIVLG